MSSSPATFLSNVLSTLTPRPPTPPRETHHELSAPIKNALHSRSSVSVHTPPGPPSPGSSAATNSTSRRIRKKVGFSAQAEYKDPPVYREGEAVKQHPTPVSLPRSASKPVKSILKVTNHVPSLLNPTTSPGFDPSNPNVNLAAMLESTTQQLAGGDRESKLDSYEMLTRALKASNNLPDRVALQEKMSLFMQFIQRDIVSKTPQGTLDATLVNHALNMLITFLNFPAIASSISNDFGIFIVDHCIRSFEDSSTPKDIARRLMQVLSLQNFPSKVMSSDRVGRLVSSLHKMEEHLKGKSIVLSRVYIYRKLVMQSRQLMIVHSDWLFDLFTDMLSNLKDIRSCAIALGLELAFSIGHEKHLARKVMEIFNSTSEDQKYIQYYEERLKAMIKDKHESVVVPDIWSVVILLLRLPLDKWEHSVSWLHLIQDCFNSSDFATKVAANRAWNRLTFLMNLENRTFGKHIPTLVTPLISQLKRKGAGKTTEELRQAVFGGICNLLYYTFKPNTNPSLLDVYWDRSVEPIVAKLLDPTSEAAQENLQQASAILGGLLDCTTPRRWKEDRIQDTTVLKPTELPPIDPKWIQRNVAKVFSLLEKILTLDFLALADQDSATFRLWQTLVTTIASAAAKDIKVSKDTAAFVAETLNVLQKVWTQGVSAENGPVFLLAVRAYLRVLVSSLGLLPLTEKPGKNSGIARSPLYTLFSTLSALAPGLADDKGYGDFFSGVFAPFFASKTDKAKMDLAQDLFSTIPLETPRPYGVWLLVADQLSGWLEPGHNSHHSTGSGGDIPIGHDYREIVKVLERGIKSIPNLPWKPWESLFYALFERVREETGDAGVAILVIEPLSKALMEQYTITEGEAVPASNAIRCVAEVLSVATQPRDRQAVDAARRRLWGTALAGSRSSSFDTFDHLYKAVSEALISQYKHFSPTDTESSTNILKELEGFFERCNPQLFLRAMLGLQHGFLPWVQDDNKLLGNQSNAVSATVKSLWDKLSTLISGIDHPEQQLENLEQFFCASFASCHRSIVNSCVALWNRMFQSIAHLEYPAELKAALIRMQLHADIVVPGLETASSEHAGQGPVFVDSFDDFSFTRISTRSSSRKGTPRLASSPSKSPAPAKVTASAKKKLDAPPIRRSGRTPVPRLRHDDSQVQFAAIEPSPVHVEPLESQVLTERQKEVRERQRENAALFPEIRSSPRKSKKDEAQILESRPSPILASSQHVATPEPDGSFDDFVSSTPTPRRGQPMYIPEQDMTDPPSSPPEPRRNPLAAEIRSRSASHNLLDEWQFSSSPIGGSPVPARHGEAPNPAGQNGFVTVVALPEVSLPSSPEKAMDMEKEPELPEEEVIADSMIVEQVELPTIPDNGRKQPSTPLKAPRTAAHHETPTPKSDEMFVDAPSTPPPPSPGRAKKTLELAQQQAGPNEVVPSNNTSFGLDDADERSMIRLVVELDAGTVARQDYVHSSASPEATITRTPTQGCIVVEGESKKTGKSVPQLAVMPARITRSSSRLSTPDLETIPSSQPVGKRGRPKRKRTNSTAQDTNKRTRHDSAEDSEVPDSQPVVVDAGMRQEQAVAQPQEVVKQSMERIPDSSPELSSPPTTPSEENAPAGSAPSEHQDAMDVEAGYDALTDDEEVQSQIALESFSASQRRDDRDEEEDEYIEPAAAEVANAEESMEIEETRPEDTVSNKDEEDATTAEEDPVQKLMNIFRGGLDTLRTVQLSRQDVYQIEDLFMDVKRELYEAERRGRT
ncbi:putative telomere length regulator protein rif1 [Podospora australis]|uniref:Telomere length regulator protein rif1 n=1 Tax=Podospora australis TaxID=1536484 RepID=A0AAN6X0Q2_9PEZI|nr:putative telomere length regulator protein rif1 [Podospora australis]